MMSREKILFILLAAVAPLLLAWTFSSFLPAFLVVSGYALVLLIRRPPTAVCAADRAGSVTPKEESWQRQLMAVFDGIEEVIYVADPDSHELLFANEALRKAWGDEVIGRKCFDVLQNRNAPCPFCTNDRILGKNLGKVLVWEFQNEVTRNWYRCADKAIRWTDGRWVRFELAADITRLKLAESELQESITSLEMKNLELESTRDTLEELAAELERSNKALDEFAYIASHDLKEPLRGIKNYAEFLLEDYRDRMDADGIDKLETLPRLSKRLEEFIDALLTYSRVGRTEQSVQETDLNGVLEAVVDSLRIGLEAQEIDLRIPEKLPRILCRPHLVGEIFRNLITNAMKYNDKPDPWIEIGWIEQPDGTPVFHVRDNGIGIRDKHQEMVFRIFKRLHGRDRYGGGTGAGLTIVKKMVEQHGGRIWLESEEGVGTTFFFTLQAAKTAAALVDETA